ncbi:response regulator [Sphingomonas sp. NPDC092331]|uniref:response regulator n=1 Tax=unclassified Sphingomonas TaxID=196159 RepID=UPI000A2E61BA|nr:response regulator [Sphingomonas sp. IBVSS2]OSZ68830.1 DNA-binding response regulator [Sphingomonas sp. IBVSS2]
MENALILIVEDEPQISRILCSYLEREGYRTVTAQDGEVALIHHQSLKPDLVLLDVGLPKRDGFSVLADLRARGMTPVIMTTARAEDLDKLSALRIGADDYVVKPFNPLEVVARVKAVLRRSAGAGADQSLIRFGALQLDTLSYTAAVLNDAATIPLDLTLTEYRLLSHMLRAPRRVFDRAELVDACLPEGNALERTVDSHISNLRRKLDRAGMTGLCVVVRGVGYRLAGS